jgi:protein associated with RNAse G/E
MIQIEKLLQLKLFDSDEKVKEPAKILLHDNSYYQNLDNYNYGKKTLTVAKMPLSNIIIDEECNFIHVIANDVLDIYINEVTPAVMTTKIFTYYSPLVPVKIIINLNDSHIYTDEKIIAQYVTGIFTPV